MRTMEYAVRQDPETGIVVVATRGTMNADDFLRMAQELLRHPARAEKRGVLFDHTALDFSRVRLVDLERIRAYHREHDKDIGPGKCAILLASGKQQSWEKLWSQGQKISALNEVRLFEDLHEARDWLGRREG